MSGYIVIKSTPLGKDWNHEAVMWSCSREACKYAVDDVFGSDNATIIEWNGEPPIACRYGQIMPGEAGMTISESDLNLRKENNDG